MHSPLWLTTEIRAAIFFGLLFAMLALEHAWPRRASQLLRALRWPANFGMAALNTTMLWLIPMAAVGAAYGAQEAGFGLLNQLTLPAWAEIGIAWLALDCAIYWQHRAFHEIRALWPLHRVHHSDVEFDTTTAVRFHPTEILLSLLVKSLAVTLLGAPPIAVLLLETTVNGFALFNHANLRLPRWLESALRRFVVTPDLHRIHHSVHRVETDSNYGSSLVLWDRLFGSYTQAPRDGHEAMRIGLPEFRDEQAQKLASLLTQPLK
ncbi:MAG: sterol desaturase family protein [Pseudomonadota bacterium]